jgi:hypothetical protein
MSSEQCKFGCQPPYMSDPHRPCPACQRWHDEAMDRSYEEYRLQQLSDVEEMIISATDREWHDHLDQVAPVVASNFSLDFRSKPFIDSTGPYETL